MASTYLEKDFSSTQDSRRIFTVSAWVKRSKISDGDQRYWGSSEGSGEGYNSLGFDGSDRLKILTYNSLKIKRGEIDFFSKVIEGLNVQKIINKGFCYAEDQDGKIISDAVKISNQQSLVLNFRDGTKRVTAS